MTSAVQHFTENKVGTDYCVGDIHGCFEKLERVLAEEIGFDPTKDRLFSVGDLVDRGPSSEKALDWLEKPWFHAVRGNHEQMAIDFIDGCSDRYMYAYNGGQWFLDICDVDDRVGKKIADTFRQLPIAIDITVGNKVYGIIHAACPGGDWARLEEVFGNENLSEGAHNIAMWDRTKYNSKNKSFEQNVELVYVGHTPTREIEVFGNVIYIDQGACFGGKLTVLEIY